ncbi:E3 ubiquitin-protein ligase TRIM39 isoform X1 [Gadus morhua]|uniref:Si:dkey-46i9.6 n=1 Tax=Gadus morhua TaxID=8049 RepID=A0A8C5F9N9_GADMO|nr:E3 ubiquitin-protein ligase TRIM39-like isoform X1 [Gadus morhua]XP_030193641.1 E3 ubiquitin-protein ligase TRIM39-like isoform X1 [Gadus morhua]
MPRPPPQVANLLLNMTLPLRCAGMAANATSNNGNTNAGNLSEEQVHCSICLDVFTNPVSIPCGHNFCQSCILGYWRTSPSYQCPMCKKSFAKRPDVSVNTVLREIAQQFKEIRVNSAEKRRCEERRQEEQQEEEKRWGRGNQGEDEEQLLQEDKREQLLVELKERQAEERRRREEKEKKPRAGLQDELPPLVPPSSPPSGLKPSPSPPPPPGVEGASVPRTTPERPPRPAHSRTSSTPPSPRTPAPPPPPPTPPTPVFAPWAAEEVLCDVCLGGDRPAAEKSCLVCLTSYCGEHLRSHTARFTKHKLIQPVANMAARMCPKHERLLELFCKKEQTCVCVLCTETDHRSHYTVPVEREWMDKKAQLKRVELDVQQMISERQQKVEEIKKSVDHYKASAAREVEECGAVFAELVRVIQRAQAEMVRSVEEGRGQAERRAQGLVAALEQEIAELQRRNTDLESLGRTDHIHFLQSFPAFSASPIVKDWSGTSVPTDTSIGTIRRAVAKLQSVLDAEIDKLADGEIKKLGKYTADLTLDPDTANPWLQLSQDRRQVRHLGAWQDLPDTPHRFDTVVIVLGREGFAAGRHYWEVAVGEKDDWYLGVARSSVKRKGRIAVSVAQGYWALAMKKGQEYRVSTAPPSLVTLDPRPKRVGVYVDCEEGQVSFYDAKARKHIYTFWDTLGEKVFPFFYLYCCDKASDTMVICPAGHKAALKHT